MGGIETEGRSWRRVLSAAGPVGMELHGSGAMHAVLALVGHESIPDWITH